MLGFWWILLNLTALVIGQGCSPTFSWSGRNCGVNCEACLNIRFNNVGRGDQACLRRSTFAPPTSTSCIFQGNLNGDGSFIAVTSSTLSRIDCQRSLKDLEISLSSNACAGSFIVKNGRVSRPPPAFIPGIREDIALVVPDQDQGVPTFLPARVPNPNRVVFA
eukprot:14759.XXX_563360_563921_1 [CDS] Oithona nana genome sequencing.